MSRRGGGDVPYDRDLIRSGGVGRGRTADRRRQAAFRRPPPGARPSRRRRRGGFGRTLRRLVVLAIVGAVVIGVLVAMRAAAFNGTVSSAPFPSTALLGPLNGSDPVNVLMVGYGGEGHDGAYLADSIQVLSIDPSTDTTTTIPIPRDLWVEGVGSFGQNGKANEVFATGYAASGTTGDPALDAAGDLMAAVLTEVTGLQIDHWLSIDFAGFEEMVDAVGGVTVENPVAFAYTHLEEFHEAGIWNTGSFEAGEIHLDGTEALAYTRARYTSVVAESTDYARSIRQARVLSALRASLGDGGVTAIPAGLALMDAMEGRVRTNLSAIDLFLLSSHISSDRRLELTEDIVLTATTNTIGQYILIPIGWTGPGAYDGLRAHIRDELSRPVAPAVTDAP